MRMKDDHEGMCHAVVQHAATCRTGILYLSVQIPAAPLPIYPFVNTPGKAEKMTQVHGLLPPTWESRMEFQTPGQSPAIKLISLSLK